MPVLNVPLLTVMAALVVNALPSVHAPPTPLNVTAPVSVVPFVVTVLPVVVALNVVVPVLLQTVPATKDMEPVTARVGPVPVAKVTVPAETVMSRHSRAPVIVTVYVAA